MANFQQNPLSGKTHEVLSAITSITISLSPRVIEDWEKMDNEF
jgi:hypothetical protein